jgi:LuxR family maltose regulon positive regulatory protein
MPTALPPTTSPDASGGPTLLATKLYVPPPPARVVPRPRLLERLDRGLIGRLILLSAPAGFGKTTLLSTWLVDRGYPVAWVSLDPGDNDPPRFLSYVIAALQTISPGAGTGAQTLLRSPQRPPLESVLTLLINELCSPADPVDAAGSPCILTLDDYHVIDAPAIHDVVTFLLDHLPPRLRVTIATRVDPPLPLSRWRSRGHMVELRADDLRFTAVETALLLNQVVELNLSAEQIAVLEVRTEGWVAGLQLAALSLLGRSPERVAQLIQAFSGSHHYIMDYLVEEVLERQPAWVQTFLLHTSILDRLTGSLCDAVSGQTGGGMLLERLEKAHLFLVSLDEERRWYRYHQLFSGLLRHQLNASQADLVPELHRRASLWYERSGYTDQAIQHALAAQDWPRATSLMDDASPAARRNGEFSKVLGWVTSLPELPLSTNPRLCIAYAWAVSITGQFDQAEKVLARIEPAIQEDPLLRVEWLAVKVFTARSKAHMLQVIEHAQQALRLPETQNSPVRGPLMLSLSIAFRNLGKPREAAATAEEAIRVAELDGEWHARAFLLGLLGLAQAALGDLHLAFETYQRAVREQPHIPTWAGGGFAQTGLAALYYEWDELGRASEVAQAGLEYSQFTGHGEIQMNCLRQLAYIHQAQGDIQGAREALDQADQIIHKHHLPNHLAPAHVHVALAQGDLPRALHWIARVRDESGASIHYSALPLERAKLALAQGDKTGAATLLAERYETAARDGIRYAQIEIRILQALAAGDEAQALAYLSEALTMAQPEGYVRIFVEQGTALIPLLHQAANRGIAPGYTTRLLSAQGAGTGAGSPATQPLIEPLSERELEVLQLLAAGKSNREIADELVLATGTVKKHLNKVYGKLQVKSRTQCVARARELHLLN